MQDAKIKTQPRLAELGGVKNDRLKMKNSKSETLTPHFFRKVRGKQYAYSAEVALRRHSYGASATSATKA
ncbi:MAG: hypothetical protein J7L42_04205, partial [Elusimicrobia bacterium]|nr:hypothetical protein [Elusimicrobiota bacterium]